MQKDMEMENDEAISKLANTIKTDEEQWDSISNHIKQEQKKEKEAEVNQEVNNMQKSNQFESLHAATQNAATIQPQSTGLTKIAQQLGEKIKPETINL